MQEYLRDIVVSTVAAIAALAAGGTPLKAQAAAEYSLGVSRSAAGAAGFGNAMNRSLPKAAARVSGNPKTQIHQSPAQVMKENRATLEKRAGDEGGMLRLNSDPDDAAVFIDGQLVARTPSEIKVPTGDHKIMIARPDRDQWSKQVTVAKGQTLELSAKLVNTNPSVISLSFDDAKK